MIESLHGRVVLITGASRGIGREFALALARRGARLSITARSLAALQPVHEELTALGADVLPLAADVSDPRQCADVADRTISAYGAVDGLVNNAGIGMRVVRDDFLQYPVKFWEVPPDKFVEILAVNAFGPFFMTLAVIPTMLSQKFGRIVNVSTRGMTMVRPEYIPYGSSKAAVDTMSRAMAAELAGSGVTVNVLMPGGPTDTDFFPGRPGERRGADGKLALPASIMNDALLWLLSNASSSVSGRRFVGRLWNASLPAAEAALMAMTPIVEEPMIL